MTAADLAGDSGTAKKFRRLTIAVVAVVIVYCGAWFIAAQQIESRLQRFFDQTRAGGFSAECSDMDVRGFPFRIGVFCDKVRLDDTAFAASASFGELRSAAQVYQPGHAILELDGPAEVRISPGLTVSADWSLLHASVNAGFSGVNRFSATYDQMKATAMLPLTGDRLDLAASHGETHLRRNGPDLDVAANVEALDVRVDDDPSLLPPTAAAVDLTLFDRADLVEMKPVNPHFLRGSKGELRNLTLDFGGGMVGTASGPFSIDDKGLISGEFKVTIKEIANLRPLLVKAFPDEKSVTNINNTANMLRALNDGGDEATVKIDVRDGNAWLAFFPLGELPVL
ncbi:hypothetical protein QO002_003771 [Pararhizobium capsulatum DSM 1112]|uniref:DUF2125 domain-containing protein n=1 Tax=Pararhizobium capsulatum DSM 1112 TaxID=1121113 RepID=A0ABU0BTQ3_9HYPH|nr:DUF2125 domain-containing protein [Pararhizobium capsulatum]MDQ0321633.1 hypothetical protein [Pararhizobium capsulatum DSM 1112]